jgi:hypothetical protein
MVTFARSGSRCYLRLGLEERASRGALDWSTRLTLDNERMRASERSRAKYPLATISAYGPDNRRATKLVVGILRRAGQKDANPTRRWSTDASDVRNDPVIAAELADWLRNQGIKHTVSYDRIIGCPHEQGIDYPIGRTCPRCPFWASIDRFTHEPIPAPIATMSPDQVLIELGRDRTTHPLEALESADAQRGALVQPFLQVLERGVTDPDTVSEEESQLFCYAAYLLAKWRETRAYPLVIRWLSLPDAASTGLSGDVPTQDGARILAAVCDGDLEPIKRLVLNRDADEFSRGVAVAALALLAVWAEVPRAGIVDYFTWLAREGLEREPSYVWSALATESADIEALAVFPELRRAYDEELIDPRTVGRSELDDVESLPRGNHLERMKDRHPPIDDVAIATSWWARFGKPASNRRAEELALAAAGELDEGPMEPYRAPQKLGRNEPCPCGSGKKYKKCCAG